MIYVVSEYAKFEDIVLINVEAFDNEIRAKNYMISRIEEFKHSYYVITDDIGLDYAYLGNNHRDFWIRIHKRELM